MIRKPLIWFNYHVFLLSKYLFNINKCLLGIIQLFNYWTEMHFLISSHPHSQISMYKRISMCQNVSFRSHVTRVAKSDILLWASLVKRSMPTKNRREGNPLIFLDGRRIQKYVNVEQNAYVSRALWALNRCCCTYFRPLSACSPTEKHQWWHVFTGQDVPRYP